MTPFPLYSLMLQGKFRCWNQEDHDWFPDAVGEANKLSATSAFDAYAHRCDVFSREIGFRGRTHIEIKDYPECTAPWRATWIEWQVDDAETKGCPDMRYEGALVVSFDKEQRTYENFNLELVDGYPMHDSRHFLQIFPVVGIKGFAFRADSSAMVSLNDRGQPVGFSETAAKEGHRLWTTQWHVPLFAFCLANCKNIAIGEREGVVKLPGYKGRKKKAKKFYRYHVLTISGSSSGGGESDSGARDSSAPMHICRGNFAHYTDEKPLFGKITGLFWRPMHVRGSVKHGVVDKDYELAIA